MSGHSKWSKIKRQKGVTDAKRGKIFTKLARMISVEAKKANVNELGNKDAPGLQFAIKQAREANMPSDNIERAIKKGDSKDEKDLESIMYEAYGPGGVGIIIETMTENRNKAAQEIKHILTKQGLALAGIGSVMWAFEKVDGELKPKSTLELSDADLELLTALVYELEENDEVQNVYTNAE